MLRSRVAEGLQTPMHVSGMAAARLVARIEALNCCVECVALIGVGGAWDAWWVCSRNGYRGRVQ